MWFVTIISHGGHVPEIILKHKMALGLLSQQNLNKTFHEFFSVLFQFEVFNHL